MSTDELTPSERESFINRLIDKEATDAERARLAELVGSDPGTRQMFVERICLDSLLRELLGPENLRGAVDSLGVPAVDDRPEAAKAPAKQVSKRTLLWGIGIALTSVAAILVVGVAILLRPAIQATREATAEAQSVNNLKQIGLALHSHNDELGTFPAAYNATPQGQPLLSWRVHLLPYLGERELYEQFHLDEPWDSPHNSTLIPLIPAVYRNPERSLEEGATCYQAIALEESVLPPPGESAFGVTPPPGITLDAVTDGPSGTIAVVEVDSDHAVVWSQPDDNRIDVNDPLSGLDENPSDGFLALFLDGVVRPVSSDVDPRVFLSACSRAGGEADEL